MIISGHEVSVASWCHYWVLVIVYTIVIKALMASVRVLQVSKGEGRNRWEHLSSIDYWVPTIVGTVELAIYPILISLGSWQAISAWIGIKTAGEWRWKGKDDKDKDRQGYTNFLLGNALVIGAAFLLVLTIRTSP